MAAVDTLNMWNPYRIIEIIFSSYARHLDRLICHEGFFFYNTKHHSEKECFLLIKKEKTTQNSDSPLKSFKSCMILGITCILHQHVFVLSCSGTTVHPLSQKLKNYFFITKPASNNSLGLCFSSLHSLQNIYMYIPYVYVLIAIFKPCFEQP